MICAVATTHTSLYRDNHVSIMPLLLHNKLKGKIYTMNCVHSMRFVVFRCVLIQVFPNISVTLENIGIEVYAIECRYNVARCCKISHE